MILNKSQAKAVYDAMVALNNVNAEGTARFKNVVSGITHYTKVNWMDGNVMISAHLGDTEFFSNQSVFAIAYWLE